MLYYKNIVKHYERVKYTADTLEQKLNIIISKNLLKKDVEKLTKEQNILMSEIDNLGVYPSDIVRATPVKCLSSNSNKLVVYKSQEEYSLRQAILLLNKQIVHINNRLRRVAFISCPNNIKMNDIDMSPLLLIRTRLRISSKSDKVSIRSINSVLSTVSRDLNTNILCEIVQNLLSVEITSLSFSDISKLYICEYVKRLFNGTVFTGTNCVVDYSDAFMNKLYRGNIK